jgi:hypothetical protein
VILFWVHKKLDALFVLPFPFLSLTLWVPCHHIFIDLILSVVLGKCDIYNIYFYPLTCILSCISDFSELFCNIVISQSIIITIIIIIIFISHVTTHNFILQRFAKRLAVATLGNLKTNKTK